MSGVVVDRIEGNVAVVEVAKGEFRDVPLDQIAGRARDGAVLVEDAGHYTVDEKATAERAEEIAGRRRRSFMR